MKCPKCGKHEMHKDGLINGKVRWRCRPMVSGERTSCYSTSDPTKTQRAPGKDKEQKLEFKQKVSNKVVVTWAQNATPVHKGFLQALQAYCRTEKATLIVIPGRYKNPTSRWEDSQANAQWWVPDVEPYLLNQRTKLNANLTLMADIIVQPTATHPLSGFEGLTHGESGILGHPKLQMTVVPTPHQRLPKILTTTGAVTVENYSDTKAGKKGEFHHVQGAVVIELSGNQFHMRHINARSDGAFCDLDRAYFPDGSVTASGPYLGLVFGDAHPRFADPQVVRGTFGNGGLVQRLNPETLVFHDLLDSYAVNPHHIGNPFIGIAKRDSTWDNIEVEVGETIDWLIEKTGKRQAVIVPSNHDDMLARYIRNTDWRTDPENARFYLMTAYHMACGTEMTDNGVSTPDPFHFWVEKRKSKNIRCLKRNESFTIADIECGLHGHEGPNGARGTLRNLSKLGAKVISGHSHTPGIEAGHYKAGTMTYLQLEYTGPISSWLNAHVSIDPFGKRHIHICVDGRFWS